MTPPKKSNQELGAKGERQAAAFLVDHGYQIINRNLRLAGGEIDILARDVAGTLIVVEVKSRHSVDFAPAQANITPTKLATLARLAHAVSDRYPNSDVRVDVIEYDASTDHLNQLQDVLN
ncbi:MAG: YraN family protein [bacterium]|nr:YraN family protein [bacterium]